MEFVKYLFYLQKKQCVRHIVTNTFFNVSFKTLLLFNV